MHYLTLCAVFTFFSYSLGDNAFDDSYFALLTDIRNGINEQIQNYLVTPLFEKIKSIIDNRHTDCVFRCPQGKFIFPKSSHRPTSNGCGSFGFTIDKFDILGFQSCCDQHDTCYDMCGSRKDQCDNSFKKCLNDVCDLKTSSLSQKSRDGCQLLEKMMHAGTVMFGCEPYLEAQKVACECRSLKSEL